MVAAGREDFDRPLYEIIERASGVVADRAHEEIAVEAGSPNAYAPHSAARKAAVARAQTTSDVPRAPRAMPWPPI